MGAVSTSGDASDAVSASVDAGQYTMHVGVQCAMDESVVCNASGCEMLMCNASQCMEVSDAGNVLVCQCAGRHVE